MNYLLFAGALALVSAPAMGAPAKATKESAVAALQKWEVCFTEQYELVAKIQEQRASLPEGADTPEELKEQMRKALLKKTECDGLKQVAEAEALRLTEGK